MILKNKIKNFIYFFLNFLSKDLKNRCSILMYHCVNNTSFLFNVRPKDFAWQMKYLKDNNFNVISYAELVDLLESKKEIPTKTVVLTFDDGFLDNYTTVFPVLKKHNFPATIFLTTSFIDGYFFIEKFNKKFNMLTWEQIKEMENSGLVDFQPHTINHHKLAKISKEEMEKEIKESKKILEEKLDKDCNLFAYPFGNYDSRTVEILKRNGFKSSVTVESGLVYKSANLLTLPRNFVYLYCGKFEFKGFVKNSVVIFNVLKKMLFIK